MADLQQEWALCTLQLTACLPSCPLYARSAGDRRPGGVRRRQPLPTRRVGRAAAAAGECCCLPYICMSTRLACWTLLLCSHLLYAANTDQPPAYLRCPSCVDNNNNSSPTSMLQPGRVWERVVDTSLQPPDDALMEGGTPVR